MAGKKKTKTIARLVNDAAELLQKIRRIEEADDNGYVSCVTCGVTRQWNDGIQGGHFISRVKTAHKLKPDNIWPQCKKCNGPLRGNHHAYTLFMVDRFGREYVDDLLATQNETRKYSRPEIMGIIEELRAQLKDLGVMPNA